MDPIEADWNKDLLRSARKEMLDGKFETVKNFNTGKGKILDLD